jgi:hypothetical protein
MNKRPGDGRRWDDDLGARQSVWVRLPPEEHRRPRARPRDRSRWYWLLVIAVVVPLLTPLYNRVHPRLFGVPFFYWCQMAFIGMGVAVTAIVYQATKGRR